jgi:hypothetical protein
MHDYPMWVSEFRVSLGGRSPRWRLHCHPSIPTFTVASLSALFKRERTPGITQAELGQRQTFISKVELGERRLDVAEFIEISRAMQVDPYALMREAEGAA